MIGMLLQCIEIVCQWVIRDFTDRPHLAVLDKIYMQHGCTRVLVLSWYASFASSSSSSAFTIYYLTRLHHPYSHCDDDSLRQDWKTRLNTTEKRLAIIDEMLRMYKTSSTGSNPGCSMWKYLFVNWIFLTIVNWNISSWACSWTRNYLLHIPLRFHSVITLKKLKCC